MTHSTRRRGLLAAATASLLAAAAAALGSSAVAAPAGTAPSWASARIAGCAATLDRELTALDRAVVSLTRTQTAAPGTATLTSATSCLLDAPHPSAHAAAVSAQRAAATDSESVRGVERAAAAASLRVLAADAAIASTRARDTTSARAWLTLRDRRAATRIGVPDAPASTAITELDRGRTTPARAAVRVHDDLLTTSLVVLRTRLGSLHDRADHGFATAAATDAARIAATWPLFASALRAAHPSRNASAASAVAALAANARAARPDVAALDRAASQLERAAAGFTPVHGSNADAATARATARMVRFADLVPVEYGRGVRDGRVTLDLELQESRSFLRAAADAWIAIEPAITARDERAAGRIADQLEHLDVLVRQAETTPSDAPDPERITASAARVHDLVAGAVPAAWLGTAEAADLDVVRSALTQLRSAAARGDWSAAERARVEAYGVFEFGPELRLRAINPGLALRVEELIWYGSGDTTGLAALVAAHAPVADVERTLAVLNGSLGQVERGLGDEATPGAIRTNSAVIVLREGMEAVLILAALTAGLQGAAARRWRRPILVGGLLALVATAVTFVVAEAVLGSLARFGERLEVVVSMVAIGVLLLILNWFVHKAYWTGWMAGFQKRKVALTGTARERREHAAHAAEPLDAPDSAADDLAGARRASAVAQLGGLVVLGFTSIYREGFETVLFLQALVLDAGTLPVVEGAAIGLVGVSLLGVLTIALQRRLPYRRMLIATGVLIAVVLAAMVGGTVQGMQAVGWLSVHPVVGLHVPSWTTTWLGVHPTWEALAGQFASVVFVIGSYVVAEWWTERSRARRRAVAASRTTAVPASARPARPVASLTPIERVEGPAAPVA